MPLQNRGTYLWMVIIGLLLATFQLQDRMLSLLSEQSLKRYGHFSEGNEYQYSNPWPQRGRQGYQLHVGLRVKWSMN